MCSGVASGGRGGAGGSSPLRALFCPKGESAFVCGTVGDPRPIALNARSRLQMGARGLICTTGDRLKERGGELIGRRHRQHLPCCFRLVALHRTAYSRICWPC